MPLQQSLKRPSHPAPSSAAPGALAFLPGVDTGQAEVSFPRCRAYRVRALSQVPFQELALDATLSKGTSLATAYT